MTHETRAQALLNSPVGCALTSMCSRTGIYPWSISLSPK